MPRICNVLRAALALAVASCATASPRTGFDPATGHTLVGISVSPLLNAPIYVFRRVDLTSHTFGREVIQVNVVSGRNVINMQRIGPSAHQIAVQEMPAGTYALVEMSGVTGFTGTAYVGVVGCLHQRAPVYDFEAGQIALMRTDDFLPGGPRLTDDAVLRAFADARVDYPNIRGDASVAHPRFITWPKTNLALLELNRACSEPPSFSLEQ